MHDYKKYNKGYDMNHEYMYNNHHFIRACLPGLLTYVLFLWETKASWNNGHRVPGWNENELHSKKRLQTQIKVRNSKEPIYIYSLGISIHVGLINAQRSPSKYIVTLVHEILVNLIYDIYIYNYINYLAFSSHVRF